VTSLATLAARASLAYAQGAAQDFTAASMNSLVVITRPDLGGFDETSREYTPPASSVIYDSRDLAGEPTGAGAIAGISMASGQISYAVGDETTYYNSLTCYIPTDLVAHPHIDDVVFVVANPDEDLVGRRFRVTDVPAGGRINASIQLSCTGIAPSRQWEI
jgi:hypothetical protein